MKVKRHPSLVRVAGQLDRVEVFQPERRRSRLRFGRGWRFLLEIQL